MYPEIMMHIVIVPKKMPINFQVITFFSIVISGSDSPTTAIINAMAVPIGTPFATNTSITGTMPAALAYIGTARITANGTHHHLSAERYSAKNCSGTYPCMAAPIAIPIIMYISTPFTIFNDSLMIVGNRLKNPILFSSHSAVCCSESTCICFTHSLKYRDRPIFPSKNPPTVPRIIPLTTYINVIFHPKDPRNIATATSFTNGDVIKKENVTPNGMPPFTNPMNNGTEEHEQKGVIAPNSEANRY